MQIKKFEASTLKDAIDTVKRELGPDAIILQTKTNKKGFGLLSGGSVEVTAAISEKSLTKKKDFEKRLPKESREKFKKLPARKMNQVYEKYVDQREKYFDSSNETEERVSLSSRGRTKPRSNSQPRAPQGTVTQSSSQLQVPVRKQSYVDIGRDESEMKQKSLLTKTTEMFSNITKPSLQSNHSEELENEIKKLKAQISKISQVPVQVPPAPSGSQMNRSTMNPDGFSSEALTKVYELLLVNGLDNRFAYELVRKASFELEGNLQKSDDKVSDQLAYEVMESTETIDLLDGIKTKSSASGQYIEPQVIAFIGPTGVGKTTTVAKIASDAVLNRKLKVGLINVDQYRIGAEEQLKTYARILNIPIKSVNDSEQLKVAIKDLGNLDLILVDTTGRSQRDTDALNQQKKMLESVPKMRIELVLSATTRDSELLDMGKRFMNLHPEGIIFSKLDEAMSFGAVYNLSHRLKLPLIYFTTGQKVPEDIEVATKERVAALLMNL